MENVDRIAAAYGIVPSAVHHITDRLYKVQTHQAAFALKKSSLTQDKAERWLEVVQGKQAFGRLGVAPVYQTLQQAYYVVDEGDLYYLMPWMERHRHDEPNHLYEGLFTTLGTIHSSSAKTYKIDAEAYKLAVSKQKEKLAADREQLLTWVEQFEQQRYMGPIPLLVCTQYKELEHVFAMLDRWYDTYTEDLAKDPEIEHSVLHGNLKASHLIDGHPFQLLNWEKTRIGSPSLDLAFFFLEEWKYVDCSIMEAPYYLDAYEEKRQVKANEESLMMLHILHPSRYLMLVSSYVEQGRNADIPFLTQQLSQTHRQLVQALQMQQYFLQIREQQDADEQS